MILNCNYSLFMCQDEDKNKTENEGFRWFQIMPVTNEPGPQYYDRQKDRFVRHAQVPERTKALVFVFVLAHEQAISLLLHSSPFLSKCVSNGSNGQLKLSLIFFSTLLTSNSYQTTLCKLDSFYQMWFALCSFYFITRQASYFNDACILVTTVALN